LSTPPKKAQKGSVRGAAKKQSFQKGLDLLQESKSIADPDLRRAAQEAALKICIGDAIVPMSRSALLWFISVATIIETAICIAAIVKAPMVVASGIVIVTGGFWLILISVALALGDVLSQKLLTKIMTSTFGKIVEKVALWKSQ
jgi:NAD/NADP transhydrogenase alpha subunit